MDNELVLAVNGLTKEYGSIRAIDDISFSVNRGTVIGLLGPNGAGKTTTINMVLGILEPTQGLAPMVLCFATSHSPLMLMRKITTKPCLLMYMGHLLKACHFMISMWGFTSRKTRKRKPLITTLP